MSSDNQGNIFKNPSLIIVLLTLIFVGGYLLLNKNNSDTKKEFLFNKQTECKNICENLYQDDKKSLSDTSVFNPRFAYNENKNTCFYSGGWISSNPTSITKRVVNCQTNEEVLTFMTINDEIFTSFCDTCASSNNEYETKEQELMGN